MSIWLPNIERTHTQTKAEERIPLLHGQGNVDWQQRVNWEELRKKRVDRAQKFMAKWGIGSAIVYNHDRRRYLSSVWNHPYSKHLPRDFVLMIQGAGFPYVPLLKELDAQRVADACPWLAGRILTQDQLISPRLYRYVPPAEAKKLWGTQAKQIKALLKQHGVADMPISVDYCNPYMFHALQEEGLEVVDGNGWIDECGMVKFDEEIILMKMAAAIHERAYGALVKDFRIGMRENEVQNIVAGVIYGAGAEYQEGWVLNSGDRSSPKNFNWSDRPIRPREFLTAEFCHINYCGYKVCYDRTFLVGAKPTALQREVYDTVVEMCFRVKDLLHAGLSSREIAKSRPKPGENLTTSEAIRAWRGTWKNHFGGMGIAWDSSPYFTTTDDPEFILERNMTVTYHARFNVVGEAGGVAIENTYRITETGCEVLTQWPYEEIMTIGL
ncbi:MAG: aminopeptidase P family protein [Hyphomicrobiales bacterium]|nr:aminopeptidase P family protein [Hyphomicrobiales bacterium]